jgi:hypothetical protein
MHEVMRQSVEKAGSGAHFPIEETGGALRPRRRDVTLGPVRIVLVSKVVPPGLRPLKAREGLRRNRKIE